MRLSELFGNLNLRLSIQLFAQCLRNGVPNASSKVSNLLKWVN